MPKLTRPPKLSHFKPRNLAYVTWHGRKHYLGKYGSPEAAAAYARFIANLAEAAAGEEAAPEPPRVGWITCVELGAAYWLHVQGHYTAAGLPSDHARKIKRRIDILVDHFGTLPVNEFGPRRLKEIQAALVKEGYARVGINERVAAIRRIFAWGESEELVPPNMTHTLATVRGLGKGRTTAPERPPVESVADEVVEATLPHMPGIVADMVRFQRFTGCRPGEVCSIRPMDVDRSGEVWTYTPATHKTAHLDKTRTIFIGPKAQDILRKYLLRAADACCFSPKEAAEDCREARHAARVTPLSCGCVPGDKHTKHPRRSPGDQYRKDSYARAVARAITKANQARHASGQEPLEAWSPNRLRHAAATEVRRQFGLEAAQVTLGHSKADVTQVYAERDAELAKRVALKLG